eukprot:COSAG04_NODE_4189_length_2244_cov_22.203730_1_plen_434_part_00
MFAAYTEAESSSLLAEPEPEAEPMAEHPVDSPRPVLDLCGDGIQINSGGNLPGELKGKFNELHIEPEQLKLTSLRSCLPPARRRRGASLAPWWATRRLSAGLGQACCGAMALAQLPTASAVHLSCPAELMTPAEGNSSTHVAATGTVLLAAGALALQGALVVHEKLMAGEELAEEEPNYGVLPMKEREYDFYLIHSQASGQDQTGKLAMLLEQAGARVWYDMQASDLTEEGMEQGLRNSRNALIFLSDGVMGREFCKKEMRWAKMYNCGLVGVHEADNRHGAANFRTEKQRAPVDLEHLLDDVEFIEYRRRGYEADAMIVELIRRGEEQAAQAAALEAPPDVPDPDVLLAHAVQEQEHLGLLLPDLVPPLSASHPEDPQHPLGDPPKLEPKRRLSKGKSGRELLPPPVDEKGEQPGRARSTTWPRGRPRGCSF